MRSLPLHRPIALVRPITAAVIILLVASSALGLVYGVSGWYAADQATRPAFIGQDVASLFLAVPLLLLAFHAARQGSIRGLLAWAGLLFYVAYSYFFFVIGGPFSPLLPVHLVLVSLGMYGALALVFAIDHEALARRFDHATPVRLVAAYLGVTSTFFAALWLSIIVSAMVRGEPLTAVQRAVISVDGVVLLPLLAYAAVALSRAAAIGYTLAGLLLVKAAATFLTLLVSTAFMLATGAAVSAGETTAYALGFAGAAAVLVVFFHHVSDGSGLAGANWRISLWLEER